MKICIINDDLKIGGKEKVIITKANEFVKNHDVSIILLGSDNSLEDNLDKRINVVYLNIKLDYSLSFPKLLSLFFPFPKKYKLSTYDSVYCHFSFKGWQLLNRLNATNKIVVIHGDILETVELPILKKNIYEYVIKILLKKHKISFVSEDLKNKFVKRKIVKSINSFYIPNPFEFDVVNREESSNKLNFINIANLIPLKNQKRLIYAFSKLIKQYENIQLFILGDGILLEELKTLTDKLDVNEKIVFTGRVKDIDSYLSNANFGVLPSIREGLPIALLEKINYELPIIISETSGNKTFFKQNKILYVDPESIEDIYAKMKLVIEHEEKYKKITQNLKSELTLKLNANNISHQYLNI